MASNKEPAASALGFACGYGKRVVVTVGDLDLPAGHCSLLLGYNGSGKSTFLKTICGLLPPVFGALPRLAGCLLPEDLDFAGELTPASIMRALCPSFRNATAVLDALSVPRDKMFRQLSKGNRQKFRVALTEALAVDRDRNILCLDEPLSGMDLPTRSIILGAWSGDGVLGEFWGGFRGHRIISQHSGEAVKNPYQTLVVWEGRLFSREGVPTCEDWPRALGYVPGTPNE